jgi:hypothetical protein
MSALTPIIAAAAGGAIAALALWVWLARALGSRIRSPLRAVPLCLPLLLAAVGYGLYWWAFFASPFAAVQMHALGLAAGHYLGPVLPWFGAAWLAASLAALMPLVRRA